MGAIHLTVREAAELSGVSPRVIEKAAEEGVIRKANVADTLRARRTAHVPLHVVPYVSVLKRARGLHLDLTTKKHLFRHITASGDVLGAFEAVPGVHFEVNTLASEEWTRALSYVEAKEAYLEARKDILGGEPVIRGTRITCRSVLGRVEGGDTIEELCREHDDIPPAAFEAAVIYARTHPPRGRPSEGKPWRG